MTTGVKNRMVPSQGHPSLTGSVNPLERELAFWIQFAEIWKDLAQLSENPDRRSECLERAQMCLARASLARRKLEASASREIPARSSQAAGS